MLRTGNYTTFRYNLGCTDTPPPLNIESLYTNSETGINKKVLAGHNWTVSQSVRNENYLGVPMSNINMTIRAQKVNWNGTIWNFTLAQLFNTGDYTNVTILSDEFWYWTPGGGSLIYNETQNISYEMTAPDAVPFTATYMALIENLTYSVDFLISNISLDFVNASADVNFSIEKRISRPADNILNHNVTWEIRPHVKTGLNITFDINQVTLWVTENMNITDTTEDTPFGALNKTYNGSPLAQINVTNSWGGASYKWLFNYTDGSNSSNPPPVVWMKPEFLITNNYGQIVNYTATRSGSDLYIKYIYVIHGYWLEVAKNISNIGEDSYQVDVLVQNIGNGWTPQFTYVTVYDFVPNEFTLYGMTQGGCPSTQCAQITVGSSGDEFYGTSYRWNIPWKGVMNSSLGPKYGPNNVSVSNYTWNVSYKVNGTGPYRVTDLYVVGLDPLRVDGASVSPVIAVITGLQIYTKEIIYVGIVAFLIVLNVTNLVITNRINRKLDDPRLGKRKHQM